MTIDSAAQRGTYRRDAEPALPDEAELRDLRDFFENAPISMHWIAPDGTILRANKTVLAFLGYEADEFVGHNLVEFHADRDVIEGVLARLTRGDDVHNVPARVITRDGSIRHVLIDSSVLRDAGGNFVHTRCCVREDGDRWQTQQRLARQADLLEQTHDAVLVWELDGGIEYWNRAAERLYGYAATEAIGQTTHKLLGTAYPSGRDAFDAALARDGLWEGELTHRRRDGSRLLVESQHVLITDAEGRRMVLETARDITERKRAEMALAATAERLHRAQQAAQLGTWDLDILTNNLVWDGVEEVHGMPAGSFGGTFEAYLKDIHPDDHPRVTEAIARAVESGGERAPPDRVVWPDGSVHWVAGRGHAYQDEGGATVRMSGTCQDITARMEAILALRDSEERYRTLAESMPAMVATTGPDGVVDYHNNRWLEYTGMSSEELRERWQDVVHPDDIGALTASWLKAIETKSQMENEYRARRHDGQYRWHRSVTTPLLYGGEPLMWIDASIDINERRRTEHERDLLGRLGEALSGVHDLQTAAEAIANTVVPEFADGAGVHIRQPDGAVKRLIAVGGELLRATTAFEIQRDAPMGPAAVLRTGNPECYADVPDELLVANATSDAHLRALRASGLRSLISVPVIVQGDVYASLTFTTGTSGRRYDQRDYAVAQEIARRSGLALANARLFDELRLTAERLELANAAKDEFLGLVSHELRTPITTIYGNARVLRQQRDLLDEADRDAALADVENEADRLQRIIENLLILARFDATQTIETEPVDLKHAVQEVASNFKRRLDTREVRLDIADDVGIVSVQPTYLELVLGNLMSNADKYSPPGAAIDLQARREGSEVHVRVLDRGSGIMPDEIEQLFSPFYRANRTSDHAPGMGIGLAVCKRILEAQGCRIWAKARDGGGAEFGFALPAEDVPSE